MTNTCTPKFIDFIKSLVVAEIEFPALKPWILAQAILECGRGVTKLFDAYKNPFGMHYHPFLKDLAVGVQYDACDGVGTYASFNSYTCAIKGYFSWFDNWEHYGDWRAAARKGGYEFLCHIVPHYCPPGMTEDWKAAHGGKNYAEYVRDNLLPEAKKLLEDYKDAPKPVDFSDVTWHNAHILIDEKTRQMEIGLASYAGDKLKSLGRFSVDSSLLSAYLNKFSNAKNIVKAEPTKAWPGEIKPDPVDPVKNGKKILLDCGHSKSNVGARSNNGLVKEELLNEIQAQVIKDILESAGYVADIYNPDHDDLTGIGKRAKDYHAFVSLHHNSYSGSGTEAGGPYCCVMCLPEERCKASSVKLAGKISAAISNDIGVPNFGGTHGEKGVYHAGLSVLNAAEPVCVGPCVLVESYFLNGIKSMAIANEKSTKAAKAIARVLLESI